MSDNLYKDKTESEVSQIPNADAADINAVLIKHMADTAEQYLGAQL